MAMLFPIRKVNSLLAFSLFSVSLSLDFYAQNLATNPSFEAAAWANANSGSVDWLTGPTNVFGAENARTGTRYMGESMGRSPAGGATDFREYIKNTLTSALVPSSTYECSIWVSLSENYGSYACNNIGFVTTNFNPSYAFSNGPIPLTPVYATPSVITNKTGWTQVMGTFVATSADTWLMVGNFNSVASTTWTYVGPATGFYYGYYFMDDVCIGLPGTCGVILPVEMLSFEGKAEDRKVHLNWKTSTELNCKYFQVERSTDGKSFQSIGTVNGSLNSTEVKSYSFNDVNPDFGKTNYYRLREFDFDGKSKFSTMVAIEPNDELNIYVNVFPVPATNDVTIEFNSDNNPSVLTIYNNTGALVFEKSYEGFQSIQIPGLPAGNYIAVLNTHKGNTISKRFIVTN